MKVGLEESKKRLKEVAGFEEAHRIACIKNQQISVERVREFETLKKEVKLLYCTGFSPQFIQCYVYNLL